MIILKLLTLKYLGGGREQQAFLRQLFFYNLFLNVSFKFWFRSRENCLEQLIKGLFL